MGECCEGLDLVKKGIVRVDTHRVFHFVYRSDSDNSDIFQCVLSYHR